MPTRLNRTELNKNTELVLLNYQQNVVSTDINPDSIPNLVPAEALKVFQQDDPEPYYKVQKIEYPIIANGINYPESFFKSFISKLKERPIPGSKSGHSIFWGERPNTDFIMVGGKIESKGKGKGFVYFKNYIPPEGAINSNETFIRENKSDMVHFSLVTYPEYHITEDDDGNEEINAISSLKGERNDAVEWGLGAMGQETNSKKIEQAIKGLNDLLDTGLNDNNENKGDKNLDKDEVFKVLKNMIANAQITFSDIAKAVNMQNQLITDEHLDALKIVNSLKDLGFKDPVKDYEKLKNTIEANAESVRNARLDKEYGTEKDPTTKKENYLRTYAGKECKGLDGDALENKIKELKEDPIMLKFAAEKTDVNSDFNEIGFVENGNDDKAENKINAEKVIVL